ncbi:MAG: hypothetical protein GY953_24910 [bacterium]|nr:hypothetical protein [bacterium]
MPPKTTYSEIAREGNQRAILETEPGIHVGMTSYIPKSRGPKQKALLYIASPGDTEASVMWGFIRPAAYPAAASRHMVFPRGVGSNVWNATQRRRYERTAMLLGRTLDDMRLYDVLCAVDRLANHPSFDGTELTIAGRGEMGILGAYAALLDERITRVVLDKPPLSHQEGPIFLNVLRYTDIPQALAMLAPRELVFLSDEIEHFEYARDIYRLLGAEERFRSAYTIPQALNPND